MKWLMDAVRGVGAAVLLQVAGVVVVSISSFSVSAILGGFVSGSALVLFGVALERDN